MLGGNTKFIKPTIEAVMFFRQNTRMSFGFRAPGGIHPRPLGIDASCRSSRSCSWAASTAFAASTSARSGRRTLNTGLVLGGNKSLLFNVEQIITIAGPVRLILFYDAGQVRDTGRAFAWKEDVRRARAAADRRSCSTRRRPSR